MKEGRRRTRKEKKRKEKSGKKIAGIQDEPATCDRKTTPFFWRLIDLYHYTTETTLVVAKGTSVGIWQLNYPHLPS